MMNRALAVSAVLLLGATASRAADAPEAVRLSLADALARATAVSPRLARFGSLKAAAEAGTRGARAARLPQIEVSAGYSRNSNVPELALAQPGAPPRIIFPNIPDNYRARAGLALSLFTSGRIENAISSAERQREAASDDRDAALGDLVLETTTAYWGLVEARESASVLSEAVAAFDAHLGDARAREEVGMAARNEVLSVQVERDRAELNRLRARNAAEVGQANLRRILGLPATTSIECSETLSASPAPAEDAESLTAHGLASRREIAGLRSRIAALAASARAQRAAALPQASLFAGYDHANPNNRVLPLTAEWKGTWSVGLAVSVTPFDGGRASAAAAQAQAQADAARHDLEDLQSRVRLEVTSCLLEVSTANASIEVARRNLEAAAENLRVSRERYREGVVASSDLLDAETALLRAGLDHTRAATELRLASARLDRAVGR